VRYGALGAAAGLWGDGPFVVHGGQEEIMELTGKTALVTGASGFIGGVLARRLVAAGAAVRGLMRRPVDPGVAGLTPCRGDLTEPDSLRAAVAGVDLVFHCAAYMKVDDLARARAVTVAGTRNLVAAMAAGGVRRLVHLSTMAVYMGTRPPLHEEAALGPCRGIYARTKLEAEEALRAAVRAGTLDLTVFRPSIVYGPGSPVWTRSFARQVHRGAYPLVGDGRGRLPYLHVDSLVTALVRAAEVDAAVGRTYNIEDGVTTWAELVEGFRSRLGGPPPRHVPRWLVAPLSRVVGGRFGIPLPEELTYATRTEDDGFDASRARAELGWEPACDLETGLDGAAAWVRESGALARRR
jgi:nucleoside-diphosphate-sugar epimerase